MDMGCFFNVDENVLKVIMMVAMKGSVYAKNHFNSEFCSTWILSVKALTDESDREAPLLHSARRFLCYHHYTSCCHISATLLFCGHLIEREWEHQETSLFLRWIWRRSVPSENDRMENIQVPCKACQLSLHIVRTAVYNMRAPSSEILHSRIWREIIEEATSIYEIVNTKLSQ